MTQASLAEQIPLLIAAASAAAFSILKISCYLTPKKQKYIYTNMLAAFCISLICLADTSYSLNLPLLLIITFAVCSLIICTYQEPFFCKLYNAISQFVVSTAVVYLANTAAVRGSFAWASIITSLLCVWFVVMRLLRVRKFKLMPLSESSYKKAVAASFIAYAFLLFCIFGGDSFLQEMITRSISAAVVSLIGAAVVIMTMAFLFTAESMNDKQTINVIERRNQMMMQYMESLEKSNERIRIMEHDKRHFINDLRAQIEAGDLEQTADFLQKASEQKVFSPVYCGNSLLNAILSSAAGRCAKHGISFNVCVRLPDVVLIDDTDMTSLLMNILDNACECCETLDRLRFPEPKISIDLYETGGFFAVRCKNSVCDTLVINGHHISSTKRHDDMEHGLGLASIRLTAAKYDGRVDLSVSNGIFTVTAVLENRSEKQS